MIKANLNSLIKVKLTSLGTEHYYNYHKSEGVPLKYCRPMITNEGFLELTLWELMSIYGSVMYHGNFQTYFENNEFYLEGA